MKRFKIGLAALVALSAMSFTLASNAKMFNHSKKEDGFFLDNGVGSCTSSCTTTTTTTSNSSCIDTGTTLCYYTTRTACSGQLGCYTLTNPKYKTP